MSRVAQLAVAAAVYAIDRPYSYRVPEDMPLAAGMRVLVPFGHGNRRTEGIVLSVQEGVAAGLKAVEQMLDDASILTGGQLRLAAFMKERYFCTFYDAVKAILPAGLWFDEKRTLMLVSGAQDKLPPGMANSGAARLVQLLTDLGGSAPERTLRQQFESPQAFDAAVQALRKRRLLRADASLTQKASEKTIKVAALAVSAEEAEQFAAKKQFSAPLQAALLRLLCTVGAGPCRELCELTGASMQTVSRLAKLGLIEPYDPEPLRSPKREDVPPAGPLTLNAEQQIAFDGLNRQMTQEKPGAALLYGVNSRERDRAGAMAEKNRFAPWDGAAMSGRMDCATRFGEVTLLRETRRQNAPMGAFSALRSGTAEPIPELSAGNCGEALLGVSREVFERSAMIRQSGLGITPSAELERRILSLVTTGEEGNSYTEASDALRRQRNRRKHNRTGRIPEREAERDELRRKREDLAAQRQQLSEAEDQLQRLEAFQRQAEQSLRDAQRYAAVERRRGLDALRQQAEEKDAVLAALRTQAEAERLPENDAIARLRGALVNLETVRRQLTKARETRDEAMKAQLRAEQAVQRSPFPGETPEQARQEVAQPPRVTVNAFPSLLVFLLFLAAAAGSFLLVTARAAVPLTGWQRAIPWVAFLAVAAGGAVVSRLMHTRAVARAREAALQKRFGTADAAELTALAERYAALCETQDAARRDCAAKSAAADAL